MEVEVSALKAAFSINNDWFEYSTIVVLAGLVFELVVLLAFHKTASWREKSILIAGTLIIAIGVAGEWHFGSKASAAALRLQTISDEKVAALAKDTAGAKKDAAEAIERAAKLEKDSSTARAQIAEANARALEAQAELARFKAPRTLSPEQQDHIVAKILQFSGQKFDMAVNSGDPEAGMLLDTIEGILKRAGWQQSDWQGGDIVFSRPNHPVVGIVSMIGVFAQMDPSKVREFEAPAVFLMGSLKLEGIEAKAEGGSGSPAANKEALHILIGKKP